METQTEQAEGAVMETQTDPAEQQAMETQTEQTESVVMETQTDQPVAPVIETQTEQVEQHVMETQTDQAESAVMETQTTPSKPPGGEEQGSSAAALESALEAKEVESMAALAAKEKKFEAAMNAKEEAHEAALAAKEKEHKAAIKAGEDSQVAAVKQAVDAQLLMKHQEHAQLKLRLSERDATIRELRLQLAAGGGFDAAEEREPLAAAPPNKGLYDVILGAGKLGGRLTADGEKAVVLDLSPGGMMEMNAVLPGSRVVSVDGTRLDALAFPEKLQQVTGASRPMHLGFEMPPEFAAFVETGEKCAVASTAKLHALDGASVRSNGAHLPSQIYPLTYLQSLSFSLSLSSLFSLLSRAGAQLRKCVT
jgi:hypothetical protein